MTTRLAQWLCAIVMCVAPLPSNAYPEGAPWGAADPAASEHCASCHWERAPKQDSPRITITGLPKHVQPGNHYPLVVTLDDAAMISSGFQIIAVAEGQPAGEFTVAESAEMETAALGTMARSTSPKTALAKRVRWKFVWRAPAKVATPVVFFVAISAANDDGSPFGDTVHYRRFEVLAAR